MKESRFIELLNLYVDQELSPTEAAELEAEISGSTARRRTYEQYCRMQKGCSMLFEAVRANAPEYRELASAGHAAERKILDFPVNRSTRHSLFPALAVWGGGLAAAAAVVTVLLVREPAGGLGTPQGADSIASAEAPALATPEAAQGEASPGFHVAATFSRSPERADASAQSAAQPDFAWMNNIQFTSVPRLSPEDLKFMDDNPVPRVRTFLKETAPQPYTPGEAYNALEFRR